MAQKKPPHGGKRKGAGRPKKEAPLRVYSVRLHEHQAAFAKLIGGGDLSEGIRSMIEKGIAWSFVK